MYLHSLFLSIWSSKSFDLFNRVMKYVIENVDKNETKEIDFVAVRATSVSMCRYAASHINGIMIVHLADFLLRLMYCPACTQ